MRVFQHARKFARKQKTAVKLEHRPAFWRRNTKRRTLQQGYTVQKLWQNWLPNKTQKGLQTVPQLYYLSIHNHQHIPKIGMKAFIGWYFGCKNDSVTFRHSRAPSEDIWIEFLSIIEFWVCWCIPFVDIAWLAINGKAIFGLIRTIKNSEHWCRTGCNIGCSGCPVDANGNVEYRSENWKYQWCHYWSDRLKL